MFTRLRGISVYSRVVRHVEVAEVIEQGGDGDTLYSNLALINARSINSKSELINDFISSSSIDVLAVTESWLSGDDGDDDLRAICPAGYSFVHHFRGSRGGGIDLIFNSMMTAQRLPSPALHSTFESLDVSEIPAPSCSDL